MPNLPASQKTTVFALSANKANRKKQQCNNVETWSLSQQTMTSLRLVLTFLVLVSPAHAAPGLGEDCLRKRSQQGACSTFFDERDGREKEYACKGDSQSGICELPAMQNEKCTAYAGHRDCDIGLDCFGSFTCQVASKMGDSCKVGSSDLFETCGSLGRCVDGVCVPLLGEGEGFCGDENNNSFMNCESHLHCDSTNTGTCVSRKEIDGDCWGSQDCVPGAWCNQYTCVGQASEGSYCEESYSCAGTLVCQQNICQGTEATSQGNEATESTQAPAMGSETFDDDGNDATSAPSGGGGSSNEATETSQGPVDIGGTDTLPAPSDGDDGISDGIGLEIILSVVGLAVGVASCYIGYLQYNQAANTTPQIP